MKHLNELLLLLQKNQDHEIVDACGLINFPKLERVFSHAAKRCTQRAHVKFVGSSQYLPNSDPYIFGDLGYIVYNMDPPLGQKREDWLNLFYANLNDLLRGIASVERTKTQSRYGNSLVASLHFHYGHKAELSLPNPYFFSSHQEMVGSFYVASLVVWRWIIDKQFPMRFDRALITNDPEKFVKRYLFIEHYTARNLDFFHEIIWHFSTFRG